jgi:outer membrane protein
LQNLKKENNLMKTISLIFTLILTTLVNTYAQQVMSIDDCINYAILNKNSLKTASLDEQIQAAKNAQIASAVLPQVGFSGGLQGFPIVPKSRSRADLFSFGNIYAPIDPSVVNYAAIAEAAKNAPEYNALQFALPYQGSCTLTVSQILFSSEIFVALQARKTIQDLTHLNTKRTEEQIRFDVTKAYYNCLIAQERTKLLDENIALIQTLESNMSAMFKEGFVEKIDVDKLTVTKNNLNVEKEKVNNFLQLGQNLLKFQMGMPLVDDIKLSDKIEAAALTVNMLDEEPVYNNRIEVQLMQTAKKLNEYNLTRTKKSNLPTVVAIGTLGASTGGKRFYEYVTLPWYASSMLGVQVSMGLYDGGRRKNTLKEINLQLQKNDVEMDLFKDVVDLESSAARTNLKNNLKSLNTQKANITLAQKVFDVATKKNKEGLGSTLEILQAQTALKEAQTNYLSALYDATISKIDLEKALGVFNKKD